MGEAMSWWIWVIIIWFGVSIPATIVENIAFFMFLQRIGARPRFIRSNNPLYLRNLYLRWCYENDRIPDARRLRIRRYLVINLVASVVAFWAVSVCCL